MLYCHTHPEAEEHGSPVPPLSLPCVRQYSTHQKWHGHCVSETHCTKVPHSGYFSGGKSFVVFMNTKFLPTKQYHKVPGCGLVSRVHKNIYTNWLKIHCSRKLPNNNVLYLFTQQLFSISLTRTHTCQEESRS